MSPRDWRERIQDILDGFLEIRYGFFDRLPLTGSPDFGAFRHVPDAFFVDNGCERSAHGNQYIPRHLSPSTPEAGR